jgi:hypothetical protein
VASGHQPGALNGYLKRLRKEPSGGGVSGALLVLEVAETKLTRECERSVQTSLGQIRFRRERRLCVAAGIVVGQTRIAAGKNKPSSDLSGLRASVKSLRDGR